MFQYLFYNTCGKEESKLHIFLFEILKIFNNPDRPSSAIYALRAGASELK